MESLKQYIFVHMSALRNYKKFIGSWDNAVPSRSLYVWVCKLVGKAQEACFALPLKDGLGQCVYWKQKPSTVSIKKNRWANKHLIHSCLRIHIHTHTHKSFLTVLKSEVSTHSWHHG